MIIRNHVSSRPYNSFNIDVGIKTLIELESKEDFYAIGEFTGQQFRILGGGSNILMTQDIVEPVLYIKNKGIKVLVDNDEYVLVSFSAGERWHDVVMWAINNNLGGIENLSLIPGNAGTAPIQNIGAYGVEIKDVLHSLRAFEVRNGIEYTFHNQECQFEYRNSLFKHEWKDKYIVSEIILKLTKEGFHKINTTYGDVNTKLIEKGIMSPSIADVGNVIVKIRQSKLPDPDVIGNAGSFFKNPIVGIEIGHELKKEFDELPIYGVDDKNVKLPAGWLIDQCGWKGKTLGETGTYKNQALVIVNHGNATGSEVFDLSSDILESVKDKFGIVLEREVNIW